MNSGAVCGVFVVVWLSRAERKATVEAGKAARQDKRRENLATRKERGKKVRVCSTSTCELRVERALGLMALCWWDVCCRVVLGLKDRKGNF